MCFTWSFYFFHTQPPRPPYKAIIFERKHRIFGEAFLKVLKKKRLVLSIWTDIFSLHDPLLSFAFSRRRFVVVVACCLLLLKIASVSFLFSSGGIGHDTRRNVIVESVNQKSDSFHPKTIKFSESKGLIILVVMSIYQRILDFYLFDLKKTALKVILRCIYTNILICYFHRNT